VGEKEAKSSRCCLVGVCKYFLFCYPLGKDSSNLGEQRRPKAPAPAPAPAPCAPGGGGGLRCVPRLPRLQGATGSGSQRSVIARAQGRVGGGRGGRRARGYKGARRGSRRRHQSSHIHQQLSPSRSKNSISVIRSSFLRQSNQTGQRPWSLDWIRPDTRTDAPVGRRGGRRPPAFSFWGSTGWAGDGLLSTEPVSQPASLGFTLLLHRRVVSLPWRQPSHMWSGFFLPTGFR
jgi:hypothetical protein